MNAKPSTGRTAGRTADRYASKVDEPSPAELWRQAGGGTAHYSRERYLELMLAHDLLIPLESGEKREPLPCGWPDRKAADHG